MRESSGAIIIDRDMLATTHIPPGVTCRESQVKDLSFCMSPVCKGRKPINAFLYGRSGSGKTAVARYLLAKLHQEACGRGIYVNCRKHSTAYSILDKMNADMRILGEQSQSTITRIANLERFTAGRPYVVILDEIDMAPLRERNDVIYHLTEMDSIGIACICSSDDMLYSLEDRVRSRFMPVRIHFPPYSVDELARILTVRAEAALYPNSWDASVIGSIASLANGDARIAIGALRCAAEHAEMSGRRLRGEGKRGVDRIEPEDVKVGFADFHRCDRRRALMMLNRHHRIIYQLIEANPDVTSIRLMELYRERCNELNTPPVARRTFSHYLSRMRDMGLTQEEQARERGRTRCFRAR